jgi:hypothetical protein
MSDLQQQTGPGKFRKKPVVVEAILYRGEIDKQLVREFVTTAIDEVGINVVDPGARGSLHIQTIEGSWCRVPQGSYIIKGTQGEFYPCDPKAFDEAYEETE